MATELHNIKTYHQSLISKQISKMFEKLLAVSCSASTEKRKKKKQFVVLTTLCLLAHYRLEQARQDSSL
jgi:hypothetical protein